MNGRGAEDAAALIGLGVVVALVGRWVGGWLGQLSRAAEPISPRLLWLVPTLALLAVGVVVLVVVRIVCTRRTLRSRVGVSLIPPDEFDPGSEVVVGFASQLAGTRRAVLGWVDRRASAVRVLVDSGADGMLGYWLQLPARALPVLRAALSAYPGLTVGDPVPLAAPERRRGGRRVRAELVLARPAAEPLREVGIDPDPLQPIAAMMAGLRPAAGERVRVALDLLPVGPGGRRRLRAALLREARRRHRHPADRPHVLAGLLEGDRAGRRRSDPVDLAAHRGELRELQGKLASTQPLFRFQLLLAVEATDRPAGRAQLRALLSCFDQFAGENHLRATGLRLAGLAFLGSDRGWRRRRFDRRLGSGLFGSARSGVVGVGEIAGLLKPPTIKCQGENVCRSGGLIASPPAGLPEFAGERELIPLGRAGRRLVGVRVADTVFSYMSGRSRYGKTELAIGQFVHLVRSGHGGLFLDPHADAIAEIKGYLTDPRVRERVVELDLADLAGGHGQPGWNLFAVHGRPAWEAGERVEAVVDAFAAALGWDDRNTRALNLTTQAARALTELAQRLPAGLAPTLFQVPTLLSDERWRAGVLPWLSPATRQFFADRFPRMPAEAATVVTNLIDRLRAARPVAALLGAPVSTFDVRRAMDDGKVVLCCPGPGSTRDRLVANLLVYEVLHAAKGRAKVPPERRRPFWLFLDELQTYDGPNLPALLEQSAKYGGRACLFNQDPERLSEATRNAVTTNRSHLLSTTVNAKAAALLAREWGGQPAPATITGLARYTFLAQVTLGDRTTKPFLVHGVRARDLHADAHHPDQVGMLEQAIDRTNGRRPVEATLAALDEHDQRILDYLHRKGATGETASAVGESSRRQARLPQLPSSGPVES